MYFIKWIFILDKLDTIYLSGSSTEIMTKNSIFVEMYDLSCELNKGN